MNILVRTVPGHTVLRPDTSWERYDRDFYLPDDLSQISFTPVAVARICKPGRCVGARFVQRYLDAFGYGILLYPDDLDDGSPEGFAAAGCVDGTTLIELPEAPSLEGGCTLYRDGAAIFSTPAPAIDWGAQLEAASRFTYIRSGDLLAVELAARAPLTRREETPVRITGPSIDFRIIG